MMTLMSALEPARYQLGELFIAGQWRGGNAGTSYADLDPYTGQTLVEIGQADAGDVDAAFTAAAGAQRGWSETTPGTRAEVLRRAADILVARKAEVVDWLIRESGSVRLKAELEWSAVHAILIEASTLPSHAHGRIIPGDIPGKEHRIYRKPVGVVTVISPWNWPLHLSSRAVAPAIALGNAVVLKPASDTAVSGGLLLARISPEEYRLMFETNVFGLIEATRSALPALRRSGGTFVNMSSGSGIATRAGFGLYSATKFAVEAISEALALEVRPLGVRVLIVEPGAFRTDFLGRSMTIAANRLSIYEETAGGMRAFSESMSGSQPGDPKRAAAVIVAAVDDENAPLRLPLGPDAHRNIRAKLGSVAADMAAWSDRTTATSFQQPEICA